MKIHILLVIFLLFGSLCAQENEKSEIAPEEVEAIKNEEGSNFSDSCRTCDPPESISDSRYYKRYKTYDVKLNNGKIIYNVLSLKRVLKDTNDLILQEFIQITQSENDSCFYTLYPIEEVGEFYWGDLGSGGQPQGLKILPAKFYQRKEVPVAPPLHHLYLGALLLNAGTYENELDRDVGFSNAFGVSAKYLYGERTRFGLNAELLAEGGRLRLPLGLEGRFVFLGDQEIRRSMDNYYPDECQFQDSGDEEVSPNDDLSSNEKSFNFIQEKGVEYDPTVYFTEKQEVYADPYRIYTYAEGGVLLDLFTEGQGPTPSLNEEDYGQYYFGAGLGAELFTNIDLTLGFRYMRLNLRTPCEECDNLFIVNTNNSYNFLLKLSYIIN